MTRFVLTIDCDGAAFSADEDDEHQAMHEHHLAARADEVAYLLAKVSRTIEQAHTLTDTAADTLLDHNGNTCGRWEVTR
jgi:hypothetical protein